MKLRYWFLMLSLAGQAQRYKAIRLQLGCLRYLHGAGRWGRRPTDLSSLRVMNDDQAEQYRMPQTARNAYWWKTKFKSSSQNNMQQFNWGSAWSPNLGVQSSLTWFWLFKEALKAKKCGLSWPFDTYFYFTHWTELPLPPEECTECSINCIDWIAMRFCLYHLFLKPSLHTQ